jgi:hypothetical protein
VLNYQNIQHGENTETEISGNRMVVLLPGNWE